MKSGTILFPSSFASIKDGIRAHSSTIIYEIITSLEEAKLIMLPVFPSQVLISCVIIWFVLTVSFCPYLIQAPFILSPATKIQ